MAYLKLLANGSVCQLDPFFTSLLFFVVETALLSLLTTQYVFLVCFFSVLYTLLICLVVLFCNSFIISFDNGVLIINKYQEQLIDFAFFCSNLVELVDILGCDWAEIATFMNGRSGKQCRERWYNHLGPKIKVSFFNPF
jgi:hypothetical protein